ncbi:glutaminyl-peptide cyclotransferase [Sphingomonas quercus]|uniref:Glutaminyl-peptide cyclotransferase n=1 Tax=Sphingomonas quercus TaxID=2842451 RepID=A0ABS6BIM2_9SPHN|nr:glutaminyl-peptide cyclotransferase [Sphingomonas quercus]MBU3078165.1 glutaminyl-peptide cyclotransferase [Sphingomonas quercus]
MRSFRLLSRLSALLAAATSAVSPAVLPVQRVSVVRAYPHATDAFTEGLFWKDGRLFESTGLNGKSSLREVRLSDGAVLRRRDLPASVFGEGIIEWGNRLVALEWQSGRGTTWSFPGLQPLGSFRYTGEGWGLTKDARRIIMSDGTPQLRFLDPKTLKETGRITVRAEGRPIANLNELEYIDGEVWANIWQTEIIARIDPATGDVKGWVDIRGLLPDAERVWGVTDVANGIAWDAKGRRLFLTGKNWPKLYEVRLEPAGK